MLDRRGLLAGILFGAAVAARAQPAGDAPAFAFGPDDVASPDGLPRIGRWMITPDGTIAHWLGGRYEGKHIREPINVILLDAGAATAEDAGRRLAAALAAAGYPAREGHSGGYSGFIGGETYRQLPSRKNHAFSDFPFEFANNHGRVFGPAPLDRGYLFTGAFSREDIAPFGHPQHRYASFDRARDDLSQRLDAATGYRIAGFVDLGNAIVGDPAITTGDHDGRAVLLRLED